MSNDTVRAAALVAVQAGRVRANLHDTSGIPNWQITGEPVNHQALTDMWVEGLLNPDPDQPGPYDVPVTATYAGKVAAARWKQPATTRRRKGSIGGPS